MHKEWCGKNCSECETSCDLDMAIYCSPDCEYLGKNGEMNAQECKKCDAYIAAQEMFAVLEWDLANNPQRFEPAFVRRTV